MKGRISDDSFMGLISRKMNKLTYESFEYFLKGIPDFNLMPEIFADFLGTSIFHHKNGSCRSKYLQAF